MSKFIQLHLLTSYPPSNVNRDDLGRPKTAMMGGFERLRISSQSLKRHWRTSDMFENALSDYIGTRTKRFGVQIYDVFIEKGVKEKSALEWASEIAKVFGKGKTASKENPRDVLLIEQLAHISPNEISDVMQLVDTLATENRAPEKEELALLKKQHRSVDIALFGRMLASSPEYDVEAACQVAHALSVHSVEVESDYFTAIDDLNTNTGDNRGSAHIDEGNFSAAVFYSYLCINKSLLIENLDGNEELANRAIQALTEAAAKVTPKGKQNSFASRAYASYIRAEIGEQQPRSLSVAFLKPVNGDNHIEEAIQRLEQQVDHFDKVYGKCYNDEGVINAFNGEGQFDKLREFVTR
ncbi:MAG: type I-E CRISPR-associated protein Cas7/Cse4/CasC [Pseudomonadota bacterium]